MKDVTLDIIKKHTAEFWGTEWFFQLMVFLDILVADLPDTVIETGTHQGAGAFRWATYFENVLTCELCPELFQAAMDRYKDVPNIKFYCDNSPDFLRAILPHMKDPSIIFLDAHGSGGDTVFLESVGRFGSPVLAEINAIKEFSPFDNNVIIVDDCDDLGTLDYPTKAEVAELILSINPNYVIDLDTPRGLLLSRGTGLAFVP